MGGTIDKGDEATDEATDEVVAPDEPPNQDI